MYSLIPPWVPPNIVSIDLALLTMAFARDDQPEKAKASPIALKQSLGQTMPSQDLTKRIAEAEGILSDSR